VLSSAYGKRVARELDVNRLRVLVEVAHARSIAEAARKLAFTPSAVSQQISKLEKELGARVLERRPTGVEPTPIGRLLVEHAERILGDLRQARAEIDAAMAVQPQRLALGCFATAGQVLVPSALAALRREHPGAELSLVDIEPPGGYGLVTSGDLDVLITHRYPRVPSAPCAGLVRRPLLNDPLRLVLPEGHSLAAGDVHDGIGLSRLADEAWISGAPGVPNRVCLDTLARRSGLELHVSYESADYHVILALVGAGLGVALVPGSLADPGRHRVAVRRLRGLEPAREVCIVHRRRPTALVRELTAFLHMAARESPGAVSPE
jgi:DNA-binding transcriptional LysR family regulator